MLFYQQNQQKMIYQNRFYQILSESTKKFL